VAADVAVVASVGLDHRDWLGDTLELIGAEKAGIFRASSRRYSARRACRRACLRPSPRSVRARGCGAGFQLARGAAGWDYDGLGVSLRALPPPALAGSIQYRNAATAIAAVEALACDEAPARGGPAPHQAARAAR